MENVKSNNKSDTIYCEMSAHNPRERERLLVPLQIECVLILHKWMGWEGSSLFSILSNGSIRIDYRARCHASHTKTTDIWYSKRL